MNALLVSRNVDARDERSVRSKERVPVRRVDQSLSVDDLECTQKAKNHMGSTQRSVKRTLHPEKERIVDCRDGCVSISQELARRRSKGLHRRGSLRSTYTESSEGSVSFSTTKLGKLLSQEGFRFDKDFEVESISPDLVPGEINQSPVSPRSALVRQSIPRCPKRRPVNALSNENANVRDAFPTEKLQLSVRRQISDRLTITNKPRLSDTKIGRMLANEGLKLENEFPANTKGYKVETALSFPKPSLRNAEPNFHNKEQQRDECPSSNPGGTASIPGSIITPVARSEDSDESVVASLPILDQPFVPIGERVPVEVLKARMEAKAAKKQEIISKIKMMDSRLSIMLSACHEASRKLKMMDVATTELDESDVSSSATEFSDVSF
mmetsp:Transcript_14147/g.28515  ORF Transcript_14147/g.28515 Transcript_14147/m.28515 type:complete len:382 (+) Transcript_14147:247-1392(+)